MTGTFEGLEADVQRALEQVVLAVARAVPDGNDVIDPTALVRQWIALLSAERRADFMVAILSHGSAAHMDDIARAVLLGEHTWSRADAATAGPPSVAPVGDTAPEST